MATEKTVSINGRIVSIVTVRDGKSAEKIEHVVENAAEYMSARSEAAVMAIGLASTIESARREGARAGRKAVRSIVGTLDAEKLARSLLCPLPAKGAAKGEDRILAVLSSPTINGEPVAE